MKIGAPFKCIHCGASLKWSDAPVIECEYCHTKILMNTVARPAAEGRKPNKAVFIIAGAAVIGIGLIAVRASKSSKSSTSPSPTSSPTATAVAEPAKPAAPAKPVEPPAIGKAVLTFGTAGTNAGQFTDARAFAVVGTDIVVAEARTGRVQVFDATGAYQRLITLPPSTLTKELTVFGAGAAPDGKVVVSRAGDLLVLDPKAGTVVRTIKGDYPDIFYHADVDVVPDGTIWASIDRTGDKSLMHVSPTGKILGKLSNIGVEYVAVDGIGTMYMTHNDSVEVRDAKGEILRKFSQGAKGKLSSPRSIAIDGKGHVFVADSSTVVIFDPEGAFIAELDTKGIQDLTVDAAGFLYVLGRESVTKYELTFPKK